MELWSRSRSWLTFQRGCCSRPEYRWGAITIRLAHIPPGSRLSSATELAEAAASMLESDGLVDLVPLDIERGRRAATIAAATGVRGADAVYLELAVQRGEVLVTWDRQQLDGDARVARVQRPAA